MGKSKVGVDRRRACHGSRGWVAADHGRSWVRYSDEIALAAYESADYKKALVALGSGVESGGGTVLRDLTYPEGPKHSSNLWRDFPQIDLMFLSRKERLFATNSMECPEDSPGIQQHLGFSILQEIGGMRVV